MPALVDTNVLVYAFGTPRERRNARARHLIADLLDSDELRLSTQILQETYVVLTRKAGVSEQAALTVLEDLAQWPTFTIDFNAIRHAVFLSRDHKISFWDALLISAGLRLGVNRLYTEDLSHGQTIEGIKIENPFLES